jgi:hypothetical protein
VLGLQEREEQRDGDGLDPGRGDRSTVGDRGVADAGTRRRR